MCWQVLSPQPWPAQDASHEGRQLHGSQEALKAVAAAAGWGAAAPRDGKAAAQAAPSAFAQAAAGRPVSQRRGDGAGFRPVGGASAMAVPTAQQQHWHPASMPEPHVMLAGSAEECRWNPMGSGVAGSAPVTAPMLGAPPTFSPVELRNMMDEESLMLFESQSHLLDPESRVALQRQREYLQWQNSLDEPGPMQSVLERQDSAGSGCNHDGVEQHDGSGAGTCGRDSGGSGSDITRELDDTRRQLASVTAERERLAVQLRRTQAELEAQRRTTTCTMCWRVSGDTTTACTCHVWRPPAVV